MIKWKEVGKAIVDGFIFGVIGCVKYSSGTACGLHGLEVFVAREGKDRRKRTCMNILKFSL
jgi:hypothetical protein